MSESFVPTCDRLDTGELPTEIVGTDAGKLLDRLFTRKVSKVKPGRCTYGVACWPDDGLLVDGISVCLAQDRYWYVQADGDFVGWLKAHALGMDVQINDPESSVVQIQGPKSMDVLAAARDDGMPEDFHFFAARKVEMGGQQVLVTRTGWTGEMGFEFYTTPDLDTDALWDHLTTAGESHAMIDIGLDAMDTRRIEAGILNPSDFASTPFESGLGEFVDLDREEPLINGPVTRDGQAIGHITAASWSPHLKAGIGYVCLDAPEHADDRDAEVVGFDLATHACSIVDLPFYDPEKKISRGIERVDV